MDSSSWVDNVRIKEPTRVKPGAKFRLGKGTAWVDMNDNAGFYLKSNTLLKDKYFRLLVGLVIIVVLITLKNAYFGGWKLDLPPHVQPAESVEEAQ